MDAAGMDTVSELETSPQLLEPPRSFFPIPVKIKRIIGPRERDQIAQRTIKAFAEGLDAAQTDSVAHDKRSGSAATASLSNRWAAVMRAVDIDRDVLRSVDIDDAD